VIFRQWRDRALAIAILLAIAFGIWMRLTGLDRKIFWYDEVATYLILSGHTQSDVRALYDGRPVQVSDLHVFQRIPTAAPGTERAVVRALIAQEPHNPPIYFWLAWAAENGPLGAVGPRAVSAISSVAAIVAIALLAFRLFRDVWIGALAAALASVSPTHVRYAQEARPYALWSLLIAGLSVLLLRAIERRDWTSWAIYTVGAVLAFHVHALSVLVVFAHAIFVVWSLTRRPPDRGAWRRPAAAFLTAAALCIPWATVMVMNRAAVERETAWIHVRYPLTDLAHRWVGIVTSVFLRSGAEGGLIGGSEAAVILAMRVGLSLAVLGLIALCAREIVRARPLAPAAMFTALLAVVPATALAIPDLVWGGRLSMVPRYTVPLWIALELCVSAGIVLAIRRSRRSGWIVAGATALVLAGAASSWSTSLMSTWWDTDAEDLRTMARMSERIDDASTVITDVDPMHLLVFVRTLKDGVTLRLLAKDAAFGVLPPSPVFLFSPSRRLADATARARPGWHPCEHGGEVELWCEPK
jgi:uncharacterized membrane protein